MCSQFSNFGGRDFESILDHLWYNLNVVFQHFPNLYYTRKIYNPSLRVNLRYVFNARNNDIQIFTLVYNMKQFTVLIKTYFSNMRSIFVLKKLRCMSSLAVVFSNVFNEYRQFKYTVFYLRRIIIIYDYKIALDWLRGR